MDTASIKISSGKKSRAISGAWGHKTIGEMTDAERLDLAILARESNATNLLELFDELPDLDALRKLKTDAAIASIEGSAVATEGGAGSSTDIAGAGRPDQATGSGGAGSETSTGGKAGGK